MKQFLPDEKVEEGDNQNHSKERDQKNAVLSAGSRIDQNTAETKKVLTLRAMWNVGVHHFGDNNQVPALRHCQNGTGDDLRENSRQKNASYVLPPADFENLRCRNDVFWNYFYTTNQSENDIPEHAQKQDENGGEVQRVKFEKQKNQNREKSQYRHRLQNVKNRQ